MSNMLDKITPARVAATVAYLTALLYPGVNPNLSAAIVGFVTGLYVLCVAVVEAVERKHGQGSSAAKVSASAPATTTKDRVIR